MSNMDQKMTKPAGMATDSAAKLHAEIKKTWSKLSDEEIKLYESRPDQFFAKLKEKQNVSREDGVKKIQELEKACGCGTAKAA